MKNSQNAERLNSARVFIAFALSIVLGIAASSQAFAANILFVGSSEPASANDQIVIDRLAATHTVTVESDSQLDSSDADGQDLIVIAASVSSAQVGTLFTSTALPLITWEAWLFDDLGFTDNQANTNYGAITDNEINVVGSHPLTAGLTGTTITTNNNQRVYWGTPGGTPAISAEVDGDPTRATIFSYDTGEAMFTGTAPARRVGWFLGDLSPADWTTDTQSLFDAAVNWALTPDSNQPPVANAGSDANATVAVPTALQGSFTDDGIATPVTTTWTVLSEPSPGDTVITDPASPTSAVTFAAVGSYTLQLTVDDTEFSDDDTVIFTVSPPSNQPPVANAGSDANATVAVPTALQGSFTDDGIATPVTTTWTVLSEPNPGDTVITDPASLTSAVTFAAVGSYTLQLTVDDTEFSDDDTVTFTVTTAGTQTLFVASLPITPSDAILVARLQAAGHTVTPIDDNASTAADANGKDLIIISSTVLSSAVGSKFTNVAVPLVVWEAFLFDDLDLTGPVSNTDYGVFDNQQTIDIIGSHPLTAGLSGNVQVATVNDLFRWGMPSVGGVVSATLAGDPTRASIFSYDTNVLMNSIAAPARRAALFLGDNTANSWTTDAESLFDAAVNWALTPDSNQPPVANAGSDANATVAVPTALQGSFTDDGIATPVTTTWTVLSEPSPGDTVITDPASPTSAVTFAAVGSYTLQLTVDDTEFSDDDTVIFTVSPPSNQPPVANAGSDANATVAVPTALQGSFTDDGIATPVTTTWTVLSEPNPGDTVITDPASLTSAVTFAAVGSYTLQLTVDDTEFSDDDTVTFTVTTAGTQTLFVASLPITPSDAILVARLQAAGHTVTPIDDNASTAADANGKDLIIISSTVLSSAVGSKFTNVAVPLVVWEAFLFDDLDLTGPVSNTDYGVFDNQQTIDIIGSHPLTAGLSGNVQVATVNDLFRWGMPSVGGVVSATLAGDPTRASIFSYDTNVLMNSIAAPARRAALFLGDNTANSWTTDAESLFDAAVNWALTPDSNQPPVANAGSDANATVAVPTALQGSFTDDGIATPVTTTWTVLSEPSPGDTVITDPASPTSAVTFAAVGSYTLQLTVDDTEFSDDDTVIFTVSPPSNQPPVANAGSDANATVAVPTALQGSFTDDGIATPVTTTWTVLSEPNPGDTVITDPASLTSAVTFAAVGSYTLQLTVDDTEFSDDDTVTFTVTTAGTQTLFVASLPITPSDAILVARLQAAGHTVTPIDDNASTAADANGKDLIIISSTVLSSAVGSKFTNVAVPLVVWEAFLFDDLDLTGPVSNTDYGVFDNQQTIDIIGSHPLTAGLSGNVQVATVNDLFRWGMPSVGGVVSATLAGDPTRASIFSYDTNVLMNSIAAPARRAALFLGDNTANSWTTDAESLFDAAVNWALTPDSNQPPVANAGSDANATVAVPTALQGSFTDDGIATPVTTTWTVLSEPSPGDTVITDPASPTSAVTFAAVGSYTLQLTVDDTEFSDDDTVIFTVSPPSNQPPVANAGSDANATVAVPTALQGSFTDDGIATPVTTTWTVLSEPNPGDTVITDPASLTSAVTFAAVGSYTLQLTVDDTEFSDDDTVTFTVTTAGTQTLFVASLPITPSDAILVARLQAAGHTVTPIDDNASTAADANGKDLIIISSTVLSSAVGSKFTNVAVPLVVWEAFLFDDLDLTGTIVNTDYGVFDNQQAIDIIGSHPLTAGLSGSIQFATVDQGARWGMPSSGAVISATLAGDPTRATLFSYEPGALMQTLGAPARRVGFFFDDGTANNWTTDAQTLFDAAVNWAIMPPVNQPPTAIAGPDRTLNLALPFTLEGNFTDDGLSTPVITTWSVLNEPVGGSALIDDTSALNSSVDFTLDGEYELLLTVDDGEFVSTDTVTFTVIDGPVPKAALFISQSNPANFRDTRLLFQLEQVLGLIVEVKSSAEVVEADAINKDLVVISDTVIPGELGNQFRTVAVPLLTLESRILDNLAMSAAAGNFDAADQTQIDVIGSGPLALGLSGLVTVSTNPVRAWWGIPLPSADNAAVSTTNANQSRLFSYESGAALTDINAPARRVFMSLDRNASNDWTADAQDFFNASVNWLLGEAITDPLRIMPLGDSITRGTNDAWSYREQLSLSLAGDMCSFDMIGTEHGADTPLPPSGGAFDRDHEGHGGFRTDQIDAALNGYLAGNVPDVALLHLGTNDIGQAADINSAKESMRSIISKMRVANPDVKIFLAQIIKRAPAFDATIDAYNLLMSDLASEENTTQSPVFLVDQNTGYDNATHNQEDELHPNDAGDALIASRWFTQLRPEIDSSCSPPP